MPCLGILGGLGPAATADFMQKLVAVTPVQCDQDHLPSLVLNLPQTPDRTAAILAKGPSPLPELKRAIEQLNGFGVDAIAIPCNTSHHWYDDLASLSDAPIIHIAEAALSSLQPNRSILLLASRGTVASGFYQRLCAQRGIDCRVPDQQRLQETVDRCIAEVKSGSINAAADQFQQLLSDPLANDSHTLILACTELPLAMAQVDTQAFQLVDTTLELARQVVQRLMPNAGRQREPR
jgi:aspartate racemase